MVLYNDTYPIYCQPLEVTKKYAVAIHKVFASIDQVLAVAVEDVGEQVAGITVKA
jgi:hypothetical protein